MFSSSTSALTRSLSKPNCLFHMFILSVPQPPKARYEIGMHGLSAKQRVSRHAVVVGQRLQFPNTQAAFSLLYRNEGRARGINEIGCIFLANLVPSRGRGEDGALSHGHPVRSDQSWHPHFVQMCKKLFFPWAATKILPFLRMMAQHDFGVFQERHRSISPRPRLVLSHMASELYLAQQDISDSFCK